MWWLTAAFAGSLSGTSLPSVGGSFSGVTEAGARGVIFQPAAAGRGDAPELAIDVAAVATSFAQQLDGWEAPVTNQGVSVQPTLMLAIPLGRFGIGAAVHSSYLRSTNYDPEGPQNLFIVQSNVSLYEFDLSGSYEPTTWLALGAGLRVGMASYRNVKGTDLGATLNASGALSPALPVGDPLLQGTQSLGPMRSFGASFVVGAAFTFPFAQFDVAFRPNWRFSLRGPVQLQPSTALDTTVEGDIDLKLNFPAHVHVGARVPVTKTFTVVPELEWVGWKRASRNEAEISNLYLSSSDPALREVLEQSGISEADFIKSQEGPTDGDLKWHNIVNASMQTVWQVHEDWEVRAGVGFSPSAIPDRLVTPSNVDFGVVTFRAGAAWQPHPVARIGLGLERYQGLTRSIRDSPYRLTGPDPGVKVQPSGNGRYAFSLWRAGLTVQLFVPQKRKAS